MVKTQHGVVQDVGKWGFTDMNMKRNRLDKINLNISKCITMLKNSVVNMEHEYKGNKRFLKELGRTIRTKN